MICPVRRSNKNVINVNTNILKILMHEVEQSLHILRTIAVCKAQFGGMKMPKGVITPMNFE
jgi:hypothetical protein